MITDTTTNICSSCNNSFALSTPSASLTNLLSALSVKTHEDGLCIECHAKRLKESIDSYLQVITEEKIRKVRQLGKPSYLIKGIDYNINSSGLWVFTKWYLLRKGPCCARGCSNCPY